MDVRNFIDLHMHIGPEILPRKFTVKTLVESEKGKISGMALKNHIYPTSSLIESEKSGELLLIGSVTLNNYVGGLNPDAVYASAKISKLPIIVWFPTINSGNFLKRSEYEIPPEWVGNSFRSRPSRVVKGIEVLDNNDNLTKEAYDVLLAIKENNCILATGHVSWREAKKLVEEAVKLGIEKIIVTHPIYQLIDMPIDIQRELSSKKGIYIEQNYAMYLVDKIPIEKIAAQIREIGSEKCIISSDMGQINNPSSSEAMTMFAELLLQQGITETEIRMMGEINPRKLIGLDEER